MKFLSMLTLACAVAACFVPTGASAAVPHTAMALKLLARSGPHQISNRKGHDVVTFYFKITGMTMDSHMGGTNVPGHGHIQMYIDHVPGDAYRKKDLKNIFSDSIAAKVGRSEYAVSIQPDPAWFKLYKGNHHLLIGLARNNYVMYPVKTASFALTVK